MIKNTHIAQRLYTCLSIMLGSNSYSGIISLIKLNCVTYFTMVFSGLMRVTFGSLS